MISRILWCPNAYRMPSMSSRMSVMNGWSGRAAGGAEISRMGNKHAADARYVIALRHSTSCEPDMAMPRPLSAGPMMIPMLVVLCNKAFAAVNCVRDTMKGTDEESVGTNIAVAIPYRKTNRYSDSTVKRSAEIMQGITPIKMARATSVVIRIIFFGNRSTHTPMSGLNTMGGTVCKTPMMVVLRGEPVTE